MYLRIERSQRNGAKLALRLVACHVCRYRRLHGAVGIHGERTVQGVLVVWEDGIQGARGPYRHIMGHPLSGWGVVRTFLLFASHCLLRLPSVGDVSYTTSPA
jgi:hypothetical protein